MSSSDEKKDIVLHVKNLYKSFGKLHVLENLNITVKKGTIYGLIGPNGAGKTTAINCILDLLDIDARKHYKTSIKIFGFGIPKGIKKIYPDIGYMPQDTALYEDISVEHNLKYFGAMHEMEDSKLSKRIDEILKFVELTEFKKMVVRNCSGGMKRRLSLGVALLHKPKFLILDEPTVGIDPQLRWQFWQYFKKLSENGITLLLTTHYLAESVNCDVIGLLKKKILIEGAPNQLKENVMKEKELDKMPTMDDIFIHYTKEVWGDGLKMEEGD